MSDFTEVGPEDPMVMEVVRKLKEKGIILDPASFYGFYGILKEGGKEYFVLGYDGKIWVRKDK